MDITDAIQFTMTRKEAADLLAFLGAEHRRRWGEFHLRQIMQCWSCLNACDAVIDALEAHGIAEADHGDVLQAIKEV